MHITNLRLIVREIGQVSVTPSFLSMDAAEFRLRVADQVRDNRVSFPGVQLVVIRKPVSVTVRQERVGAVRVDFFTIAKPVTIRVRLQRVGIVGGNFSSVTKPVTIAVSNNRVRSRIVFDQVSSSVIVGIRIIKATEHCQITRGINLLPNVRQPIGIRVRIPIGGKKIDLSPKVRTVSTFTQVPVEQG